MKPTISAEWVTISVELVMRIRPDFLVGGCGIVDTLADETESAAGRAGAQHVVNTSSAACTWSDWPDRDESSARAAIKVA